MNTNQIVDLSVDDCNEEIIRKKINRKKMNELKRYIPFLAYISNLDPIKNYNYKQLLRWLSINREFPARMAATCENNIITKYNKIKSTTEIPAHIAEVFTERDAILISDEDDEQPTTTKQCTAQLSLDLETIDLEDDEPNDSPSSASLSKDDQSLQKSSKNVSNAATDLPRSTTNKNAKDKNIKAYVSSNTAHSSTTNQSQSKNPENSMEEILEEGEIPSDGDDVKENRDKNEKLPKSKDKMTTRISEPVPNEDDIINQELFKRMDCFDDDSCAKQHPTLSKKENEEASILRHKNLDSELFSRRSPKTTRSDSLSTISSEDSYKVSSHKKKKKKRKHKRKNHDVENHSERAEEETAREKSYRRETCGHVEGKSKNPKKPKKTSKRSKEHRHTRLLYISDDDEDEILVVNKNNNETNLPENPNDSKRKHDIRPSAELNEVPTVVLSDSNDEELGSPPPSSMQEKEKNTDIPPIEPVPHIVELVSPIESVSNTEAESAKSIENVLQDINSMDLTELNDIYSKLCDATGIQLEELLTDLVGKSTQENKQSPQVDIVQISEPVEKINCEMYLPRETFNHNNSGSTMFAFQQHQVQYQHDQNPNQRYHQETYNHHPHQEIQRQAQYENVQCQQPVQLPYQHNLRPGLNLNDPRIVQRLKQIKDSPIHNLSIRESASLLMNRHVALMPRRTIPVPEITSKTATTYGEHKRLRELERKKELERQASKTSSIITTNHSSSDGLHTGGEKESSVIQKENVDKNRVERSERHVKDSEGSVEDTETGMEQTAESTEKAVNQNQPLRRSSSMSQDSQLTSEKRTKSKENISSGRITPFEIGRVVNIVLSALGPVNDDTSKKLRKLSTLQFESRNSNSGDESAPHEKASNSVDISVENDDNATDKTVMENSMKKSKGRVASKKYKDNSKKSPSKPCGTRELNNLNCTFLDYQEIFQKNCLETNAGKRRCVVSSNVTRDWSSDDISQNSEDMQNTVKNKVIAGPIKRRRQTCSALQDSDKPERDRLPPLKVVLRRLSEGGTFGVENVELDNSPSEVSEKETRNQHKPVQLVQQVKVKLKKLSIDEIKTKASTFNSKASETSGNCSEQKSVPSPAGIKTSNSFEEPILVPFSSEPVDCITKSYPKPLRHVNTNINMTMNSTKICAICNKRSLDLTSHYVIQHKTESYVSRLTSGEIKNLESQIKLVTLNRKRYKTTCVFCQDELEVHHFVQFHAHYSYHTGEYGFKCDVCEIVKPYREDVKSHQHRASRCRNGKIRTNYLYQSDLKVIYLYICKLCNFVQLNEANIHKHQRDHHCFRFEETEHVKKTIICALDDVQVINELLPANEPSEMESIEGGEGEYAESSGDLLAQEQEFLHEYPLDIKDVLINLENENKLQDDNIKGPDNNTVVAPKPSDELTNTSSSSTHRPAVIYSANMTNKGNDKITSAIESINTSIQLGCTNATRNIESNDRPPKEQCTSSDLDVVLPKNVENDNTNSAKQLLSASLSPEALLGQLHGFDDPTNIMTVIHRTEQASCVEPHQPYEETIDIKPNINDIKVENSEEVAVEVEVSVSSPSPVKQISYRKITAGINYFGLYKCMIGECWYSTNEAEKYIRHVDTHKANGKKLILQCPYCPSKSTCSQQSVKHIRTRHSMSLYQCSVCTYRSIHAGNVSLHIEINHKSPTEEKCILKCVGRVRPMENKIAALKEKIKDNINRFICRDCPAQYYSLSLMKLHLEAAQHRINGGALAMYACIFCGLELNSLPEMQVHLVTSHPNDMCYVVERELKNATDEDSVENLKYYNINPLVKGVKVRVADFKEEDPEAVETANKIELDLIECIKPLLELITESTGVYHSELYKCTVCRGSFFTYDLWLNHVQTRHDINGTVICPYCQQQIQLEEVGLHFESHLRHAYICLHCIKTFGSKTQLECHFDTNHKNFEKRIERPIVYSNFIKYYIMKGEESSQTNWIPVLEGLHEGLRNRCIGKLYENRCSEWWYEFCFEDIDMPQFIPNSETIFKCLVKSCGLELPDENTFDLHLNQHTVPSNYGCPYCVQNVDTKWESIKDHYMLHRCNTSYLCCVCKFVHHSRSAITEHIKKNHNSRDVPIITLWRDATKCNTSMSIVIPANKLGFVTTTSCFCCGQGMTNGKGVMNHLIEAHGIALCLKCELCGDILLTHGEAEKHSEKHESNDFIFRYDILSPSQYNLCVNSISPFRIDVKPKIEKRVSKVETESPNKRIKLDKNVCLNIKQEITRDEGEVVNVDDDNSRPSCSIKCVKIDQLVSSTSKATPNEPARDSICIKPIEDLQMKKLPPYSTNILNYYMRNDNDLSIDPNIPHQPVATSFNSNIQPRYNPPPQQDPQSIQYIPPPHYSNFNLQCAPVISNPLQLQHSQIIPNQPAANSVPQYYSNNNMQSQLYQQTRQLIPTQHPSSLPAQYQSTLPAQHPPSQPKQHQSTLPAQHPTSVPIQHQSTLPAQHPTYLPIQHQSSLPAQLPSALAAQLRAPPIQPQPPNNIITIKLPNNQGVATISRALPSPYTTTSYNNGPHCSYQTPETITHSRTAVNTLNTNIIQSKQLRTQNYNQPMQTMEDVAKTIDLTCPELVPICGNCQLECNSFLTLLSHFHAVHESKFRFLFRIHRRVECGYCPYLGSIASFTAHNKTFHPGRPFLCRSVIDQSRCGVCHGVFSFNPSANSVNSPKCNCPKNKRAIADCISIDTLKLLQKYGKKCVGFLCQICKKLFHSEMGCSNHIKNVHNQPDILPKIWPLKGLLFSCYLCERTEMSVQDLIIHISIVHTINSSTCTLENRLLCYKKIKLIYPRGLIVSLNDLSNTGYDEENLKKDIQTVDNIPRN